MFDIPFITENGTKYTIKIDYLYTYRPAIFAADPNDCCDSESDLKMGINNIFPLISTHHHTEIMDSWYSREDDSLYKRAEILAIKDYFEGV